MRTEGPLEKRVADQLAGLTPLDPDWLHVASLDAVEKSLIFASPRSRIC